ncbi:MAG: 30S ribosomal protein S7 [Flavobacteriales bacterium]|nr:30S ribosomal protein S7 [Flavobacteriales bacterium]MCX7651204.1 30S ribosomal protein S7 [Flavobacteriales bacterium]MDW8432469.1 30S ribosomal protein S7 [Flavobacteriales bacterium]
MRKAKPKPRVILPDPVYGEPLVTKFVNNLMHEGKKTKAFSIFYEAISEVAQKSQDNGLEVWKKALENVTPQVEVRSRRVGGATYQIPQEIRPARKQALAIKWLIEAARKRNDKSMSRRLANEILAAFKEEGGAFKKKEDTHRMAEANKAFSHFKFK